MTEWCMAHPWLTAFIATVALLVIDDTIAHICNLIAILTYQRGKHAND